MSSTLIMMLVATASTASAFDFRRFLQDTPPAAPFDLSAGLVGTGQERPTTGSSSESDDGSNGAIIAVVVVMLLMLCCCGLCCVAGGCWYMRKKNKDERESVTIQKSSVNMAVPYGGPGGRPQYSDNNSQATSGNMSYD